MKIKGLIIGLMICSLCSAQETAEGLPALLQAPNGKKVRVFVQEADTRILPITKQRLSYMNKQFAISKKCCYRFASASQQP